MPRAWPTWPSGADLGAAQAPFEDGRADRPGALAGPQGLVVRVHEAGLALEAGEVEQAQRILDDLEALPGSPSWFLGLRATSGSGRDIDEAWPPLAELCALADAGRHPGERGWLSGGTPDCTPGRCACRAGVPADQLQGLADRIATQPKGFTAPSRPRGARHQVAGPRASWPRPAGVVDRPWREYRGASHAEESPTPTSGDGQVGAARCLIALGRVEEAKDRAKHAEALLERLGRLAGRGARGGAPAARARAAPSPGHRALTPRERGSSPCSPRGCRTPSWPAAVHLAEAAAGAFERPGQARDGQPHRGGGVGNTRALAAEGLRGGPATTVYRRRAILVALARTQAEGWHRPVEAGAGQRRRGGRFPASRRGPPANVPAPKKGGGPADW